MQGLEPKKENLKRSDNIDSLEHSMKENFVVFMEKNPYFLQMVQVEIGLQNCTTDPNVALFKQGQQSFINYLVNIYNQRVVDKSKTGPQTGNVTIKQ